LHILGEVSKTQQIPIFLSRRTCTISKTGRA